MTDSCSIPAWPSPTFKAWAAGVYQFARQHFLAEGAHFPMFLVVDCDNGYNVLDVTPIFNSHEGKVAAAGVARFMIKKLDAQAIAFISEIWTRDTEDSPRTGEQLVVNAEARTGEKAIFFGTIHRAERRRVVVDEEPILDVDCDGLFANFFEKEDK